MKRKILYIAFVLVLVVNSFAVTVSAVTTFNVYYMSTADVTGMPSTQTVEAYTYFNVSSSIPKREGYTFSNWRENSGRVYRPGERCYCEDNLHLAAEWEALTYTVTYNAGSGAGAPSPQVKTHGQALYLSSTKPTRDGYTFQGWALLGSSSTVAYTPGARYTDDKSITLFAVWERDEIPASTPNNHPAPTPTPVPEEVFTVQIVVSGKGSVTGGGKYSQGSTVTIRAIPDNGYAFDGWYENSYNGISMISSSTTYSFSAGPGYDGSRTRTFSARFLLQDSSSSTYSTPDPYYPPESTPDTYNPPAPTPELADNDFEIEGGVLKRYRGNGGAVVIPDKVTSIGDRAFMQRLNMTSVTIGNNVISIGDSAFSQCLNMTSVTIGNNVTSIGESAFFNTGLINVIIPDSVTSIGTWAFNSSKYLKSVTIPYSVTSIGLAAFRDCHEEITIYGLSGTYAETYANMQYIPFVSLGEATENQRYDGDFRLENGVVTISSSLVNIPNQAFEFRTNITSVVILDGVTSIGAFSFISCPNLTSVAIPNSVTSIGGGSFGGCPNLTIYGQSGSYAETYAKANSITFVSLDATLSPPPPVLALPAKLTEIFGKNYQELFGSQTRPVDAYGEASVGFQILAELYVYFAMYPYYNSETGTMLADATPIYIRGSVSNLIPGKTDVTIADMEAIFGDAFRVVHSDNFGIDTYYGVLAIDGYNFTFDYDGDGPITSFYVSRRNDEVLRYDAIPTSSTVLVNGKNVAFDAYNIGGNNFFKLRDLAYTLNGTQKQFEVGYDDASRAITLTSGKPYTTVGGEMSGKGAGKKEATPTTSIIYMDGMEVQFTAYNIDGNNYFKLRDVGEAFDFGVDWDGAAKTIRIDTGKGYTPEGGNTYTCTNLGFTVALPQAWIDYGLIVERENEVAFYHKDTYEQGFFLENYYVDPGWGGLVFSIAVGKEPIINGAGGILASNGEYMYYWYGPTQVQVDWANPTVSKQYEVLDETAEAILQSIQFTVS